MHLVELGVGGTGKNLRPEKASATPSEPDLLAKRLREHGQAVRRKIEPQIPGRWQALLTADDVMQQTYMDAYAKHDQLASRSEVALYAWLLTVAKRNLISALRMLKADKRGGRRRRITFKDRDSSMLALCEFLAATSNTPSRVVAREEACAALNRAIERLSKVHRCVIEGHDLHGKTMEQLAKALNRTPGALFMIRKQALCRLREIMGSASGYITTA